MGDAQRALRALCRGAQRSGAAQGRKACTQRAGAGGAEVWGLIQKALTLRSWAVCLSAKGTDRWRMRLKVLRSRLRYQAV